MKLILLQKNKRRTLFTVLTLLSCIRTEAQQISGIVTAPDQSALTGATISIPGTGIISSSDLNGAFLLNNNKTGKVTLSIKYVGYREKKIELDIKQGKNELGALEMEAQGGVLGEVIISGATAGSQAKALSMKRASLGIVDVLAADAIGKLPGPQCSRSCTTDTRCGRSPVPRRVGPGYRKGYAIRVDFYLVQW